MNYKEYLELLSEDLNMIFRNEEEINSANQRAKGHNLRIRVLIFHLHADYLLSDIIKEEFQSSLTLNKNKESFDVDGMEFIEKLRIIYTTKRFGEGLFTALRILNKVRNNLSHNLKIDLIGEEQRIRTLDMSNIINILPLKDLTTLEYLLYSIIGYINILAEYLHHDVKGEKLDWTLSIRAPQMSTTTENHPIFSIINRP